MAVGIQQLEDVGKVPKFLRRLFREASGPDNNSICWSEDGERIKILSKDLFLKTTLPLLSKTKEYSAFIRQLNIYGFVKVKTERVDDTEEYYHPQFKRDQPGLIPFIKRVSNGNRGDKSVNWQMLENNIAYLTNMNIRLGNDVDNLRERVNRQDQTINGLLDILSRVFRAGIQNFNYDASYNHQLDNMFRYNMLGAGESKSDKEADSTAAPALTRTPPQGKEDRKDGSRRLPDMDDIFF